MEMLTLALGISMSGMKLKPRATAKQAVAARAQTAIISTRNLCFRANTTTLA